jgi:hypothetical protein
MTRSHFFWMCLVFAFLLGIPVVVKADLGHPSTASLPATQTRNMPILLESEPSQVSLDDFVDLVKNGQAGVVRGVYVPKVLAFQVVQQPGGNMYYVSDKPDQVTQFDLARQMGVTGLLAHDDLAGQEFASLMVGQIVHVVYGDGFIQKYVISAVKRYQALDPSSVSSNFLNLTSHETLSANDIFHLYYTGGDHLVFQTCIAMDDNLSWGRLFVVAQPMK